MGVVLVKSESALPKWTWLSHSLAAKGIYLRAVTIIK